MDTQCLWKYHIKLLAWTYFSCSPSIFHNTLCLKKILSFLNICCLFGCEIFPISKIPFKKKRNKNPNFQNLIKHPHDFCFLFSTWHVCVDGQVTSCLKNISYPAIRKITFPYISLLQHTPVILMRHILLNWQTVLQNPGLHSEVF